MGLPGSDLYSGTEEQKAKLEAQFIRKADFMTRNQTAIWNGEFGPVYADPKSEANAEEINNARYDFVREQLGIYHKYGIHWSIWLYKDIGLMGLVSTSPESKWNKTIHAFLQTKKKYQLDGWGRSGSDESKKVLKTATECIDSVSPTARHVYPTNWSTGQLKTMSIVTFLAHFSHLHSRMSLRAYLGTWT